MTIALCMIVKDEAHVIERCLASVRSLVDAWLVVDTGSSDGTQELIRSALADLPGELVERPWKDFGHNRSEALRLCRERVEADYSLMIDADEVLIADDGFAWPELTADGYLTRHEVGDSGTSFYLLQLMRQDKPWRYVGVLHEVAQLDEAHTTERLEGIRCRGMFDSARNRQGKRKKYLDDAEVLERALKREPGNTRYQFYLAQSYRDAGEHQRALDAYHKRAKMRSGFVEEVWYSLYQRGLMFEKLGRHTMAVGALLEAYQARPTRAEPLVELARMYRQREHHHSAKLFAEKAASIERPDDILFLDDSAYGWRALDELAVACSWTGDNQRALELVERVLADPQLPENERARLEKNRSFMRGKLGRS